MRYKKKYPIEEALQNTLKEGTRWIKMIKMFFFRIPQTKTEASIYFWTVSPWLFFVLAMTIAITRR